MYNRQLIEIHNISIDDIPAVLMRPKFKEPPYDSIIFYHGWTSQKENQIFKMAIFCYLGYQVLIPDAYNHGERKDEFDKSLNEIESMMTVVLKSHEEFPKLYDFLSAHNAKSVSIAGHSMGAITCGLLFPSYPEILLAMPINGSFNLLRMEELQNMETEIIKDKKIREKIEKLDAINHLDKIKDRPLYMLNGALDQVVNPRSQREFYKAINKLYSDKKKIKYIEFEETAHVVSDKMLEEMSIFIEEYTEE
ncbi:MAG: hypothetical protein Q4P29_07050 [Tissierellia bacterium]|nr:hypothetical protein [Tissierellia bacterium]